MNVTDPIADMLTRIRNASSARHSEVIMPSSKLKVSIAKILQDEGYVLNFSEEQTEAMKLLKIQLKYVGSASGGSKRAVITGIKRVSRPGLRIYAKRSEIPKVMNGYGIAIVSTPQGVMTGRQAWRAGVGGEVLAYVW
ncbi:MAG: 30S ribosomal protein S8 [Chloroflexi bacterium]|uniref:Small ribosomal subunit protein uS8 n=1 Tax=Candidatus Chlorohelix allophototropha TaxID=3003348 RepID=A0A8T7M3A2_9CHLR|nr:30S ribosomal protein S8 [Chloroflexota bacterium]WJW65640.1 30S ribosomal protein S8 [Chloroflexota bacterium L227-S17]